MIRIYFDNTLIDDEAYISLENEYKLYDKSFSLGAVVANKYNISINKTAVSSQPSSIIIKDFDGTNETQRAKLHIDEIDETKYTYDYTLTDALTLMEFYYDASQIFVDGKTTLLAIAQDICTKVGITLATTNFRGYDKQISWYDATKTARQYISYIAELNGGFARIGTDGQLYFVKQKMNSQYTIDLNDCDELNIGSYHKITRVVFDMGIDIWTRGTDTNDTLYLNSENVFITQENEVEDIYDDIKDFEFYSLDCGHCPINDSILSGDVITYMIENNNYPTIACYDISYFGAWTGSYKLEIDSIQVEETSKSGIGNQMKNIQVKIDRDVNTISQIVSNYNVMDDRLSRVENTMTDSYSKLEIQNIVNGVGVDGVVVTKVITEAGFLFDANGLKIYTSENTFNSLHDNTGTYYLDGDTIISQTTKDGTITKDLALYGTYYYGIRDNVSIENFTKDDAMFIAMLYQDNNNEEGFGHFYNGN